MVEVLKQSYSGSSEEARAAGERLERDLESKDLELLLDIVRTGSVDPSVGLSAAIHIARIARKQASVDVSVVPALTQCILSSPYSCRKSRAFLESALSSILVQHAPLSSQPLAALRSDCGPGASSLLRLLLTRVVPTDQLGTWMRDYLPLLFEAGALIGLVPDALLDWTKQVRDIVRFVNSNHSELRLVLRGLAGGREMIQTLVDLLTKHENLSKKLRKRVIQTLEAWLDADLLGTPAAAVYMDCFGTVEDFLVGYIPELGGDPLFLPQVLQTLAHLLPFRSLPIDSLQCLLRKTLLPLLQVSDTGLLDSDPQEFICSYAAVYEACDYSSVSAAVGEVLRLIVRLEPWGLGFLLETLMASQGYLGLAAIAIPVLDCEDYLEVLQRFILCEVSSNLPSALKCHFLFFLSICLDTVFADDPQGFEAAVEFILDSAGSLTCKSVSLQACCCLADLVHSGQGLVVLDSFLQEVASGLAQLVPVIRCKGLYECIRVIVVEDGDHLGEEGTELVLQLTHRLRVELQRYSVKRQLSRTPNSLLLEKCLSTLQAAASLPHCTLRLYDQFLTYFPLLQETQERLLAETWIGVLTACVSIVEPADLRIETLLEQVVCLGEMMEWDFGPCFPLINALQRHHGKALEGMEALLLAVIRKSVDSEHGLGSQSKALLVLQGLYHAKMVEGRQEETLSGLVPWVIAQLEKLYSRSALAIWQVQVSSLFLSLCAYHFPLVKSLLASHDIQLSAVLASLQPHLLSSPLDRKAHVWGLLTLISAWEESLSFPALNVLFHIYGETNSDSRPESQRKRPVPDDDSEDEKAHIHSNEELDLLSSSVQTYSPILSIDEIALIRSSFEDLQRSNKASFTQLISALTSSQRATLVDILHMEASETCKAPRRYLVPKYNRS